MPRALHMGVGLLVALLILSTSVGMVAAQETETATTTAAAENSTDVVQQVDEFVVITDYSYSESEEVMSVTLKNRGTYRAHATLTEIIEAKDSGGGTFGIESVSIAPKSEVTVEVSARRWDSGMAGVMITTSRSAEAGTGAFVSDVEETTFSIFRGSAGWADVRSATFFAGLAAIGFMVVGSWRHYAAEKTDVEVVDLDE